MAGVMFVCAECGEELPSRELSNRSFKMAGTAKKTEAVQVLPNRDLVCQSCAIDEPDEAEPQVGARSEFERWAFSGLKLDPAIQTMYALNY